jgi:predicted ATPase
MLTKLSIKNFKRFENVEIELGDPVVFIGPNNSGKTTALQALALWEVGVKRWIEKRKGQLMSELGRGGLQKYYAMSATAFIPTTRTNGKS